jgi:hypothetical protein
MNSRPDRKSAIQHRTNRRSDFPQPFVLDIPAWRKLASTPFTLDDLARHMVVFGESGSGKTLSILVQLVESVLKTAADPEIRHLAPAMIIGDVKNELEPHITRFIREHHLGYKIVRARPGCNFRLWAHEGIDVTRDPAATIKAILDLGPKVDLPNHDTYWVREGLGVIEDFLRIELQSLGTLERVREFRAAVSGAVAQAMRHKEEKAAYALRLGYDCNNYLQAYLHLVQLAIQMHSENRGRETAESDRSAPVGVDPVLNAYAAVCRQFSVPRELTARIEAKAQTYDSGFQGVMNITMSMLMELCNRDFVEHISTCPWEPPLHYLSIQKIMDGGKVLILGTRDETRFEFACVKLATQLLTRLTYQKSSRRRPTILIADEAHRIVDPGITDLVDRGRSFRTWVVLATQSLSSLQRQLEDAKRVSAADDLLNKVGTIFWLRSKDPLAHDYLARTLPIGDAALGHIAAVRPVSSFRTGETLVMRSDGSFSIAQCDLDAPSLAVCAPQIG